MIVEPKLVIESVDDDASRTLFPLGTSWLLGAHIAVKKRVFMPFFGGLGVYRQICDAVAGGWL